jgi:hypothetical protein
VDEVNPNKQPKRRRVLRARDVIPPFDKSVPPAEEEKPKVEPPSRWVSPALNPLPASALPPRRNNHPEGARSCAAPAHTGEAAEAVSADGTEIPAYDLAENILAEQRRAAGRRRRAPGPVPDKPAVPSKGAGIQVFLPELASQDLLELQQIVAQIVARDIERLCKRPDRPPFAAPA